MALSALLSGIVAALAAFWGALAVVLTAMVALQATPAQATSWVTALCLSMAVTTLILSLQHRLPIITAWSTPGAALIGASSGIDMERAAGAYILVGGLIALTAAARPLLRLIERIPGPVASGMLAGVLLKVTLGLAESAVAAPLLVLPMIALFLIVRRFSPASAVLVALVAGVGLAAALGLTKGFPTTFALGSLTLVTPRFDPATLIGLGVPLYLVTMASQNIAGAAVLKASGYVPPTSSILGLTGLASIVSAPVGAHTSNLAAISAAICTGADCHPDPARRWQAGLTYAATMALLALIGGTTIALFLALPDALVKALAGLALIGALIGALVGAVSEERCRLAATAAFLVTASGITVGGIGAPLWGLAAGLMIAAVEVQHPAPRDR